MTEKVDLLVDARWVLPVEPASVLENHSVAVDGGKIRAILPTQEAHRLFTADKHTVLRRHALIPGLINLHTHAAMTLLRGLADDLPLMEWLSNHIWPAEKAHLGAEFVYDGTRIACAEMMKGGVTTCNEMYFFPQQAARAVVEAGMRAQIGVTVLEFPTPYASDADDYLAKGLAARDEYGAHPGLSFSIAPHAPYTVSDRTFSRLVTYAEELDLQIHLHLHETRDEISESLKEHKMRPLARMQKLGLLGPRLNAVHMVHLEAGEIDSLARHGVHVAHCPSSNLKLASGICPTPALLERGINVGLGTDGAASNNRLDLFSEMRLAALLAKGASGRADCLPAELALKMATLNGARALGLDAVTGSLLPGKHADMAAVDFSALELAPCYDPLSHLVYAAGRENVSHVWVAGRALVEERKLVTLDEQELVYRAAWWRDRIGAAK